MQIQSSLDSASTDFIRNSETMRGLVAELRERLNGAAGGGGKVARSRHIAHGKMLARDRVDLLVDPGTAFLEVSLLAASSPKWSGRRRDPRNQVDLSGRNVATIRRAR